MIAFRNLAIRRGGRELLRDVDLTLHAGWRVGVVGRNGCGKSSLFAAVLGVLEPDRGEVERPRGQRLASVAQETPGLPDPALEFVLGGDAAAAKALKDADEAYARGDLEAAAEAHHRIDELGAYDARSRAAKLLHGLGFKSHTHGHAVADFSGGWRARLNLGRALMTPSDALLLDEPTNHLDLDAVSKPAHPRTHGTPRRGGGRGCAFHAPTHGPATRRAAATAEQARRRPAGHDPHKLMTPERPNDGNRDHSS
jgi:ATP-binding cassette subfamily F protein 3